MLESKTRLRTTADYKEVPSILLEECGQLRMLVINCYSWPYRTAAGCACIAMKFTPTQGRVTLDLYLDDRSEQCVLEVRD